MVGFRRFFLVLFLSFASLFIFIFIIRLANNKEGFMGFNDLFSYFENGNVDFYSPLQRFTTAFEDVNKAWDNFASSINFSTLANTIQSNVDNPYNPFEVIGEALGGIFNYLGDNIVNFFKVLFSILAVPVQLFINLIRLIIDYVKIFADFIAYIINFEGYPKPSMSPLTS